MILRIHDHHDNFVYDINDFVSLIWTKRFFVPGDFEIVIPLSINEKVQEYILYIKDMLEQGETIYASLDEDKEEGYRMIIEELEIDEDLEEGSKATISGRSLEVLLERRIAGHDGKSLTFGDEDRKKYKPADEIIKSLMSLICLSGTYRMIPGLYQLPMSDPPSSEKDPKVWSKNAVEYKGEDYLTIFHDLLTKDGYAVKMLHSNTPPGNNYNAYSFAIVAGRDLTTGYSGKPVIEFSTSIGTLNNSKYRISISDFHNELYVFGSGKAKVASATLPGYDFSSEVKEGIDDNRVNLREISIDESNLTTTNAITQVAKSRIYDYNIVKIAEGETNERQIRYIDDYLVGDIVQIRTLYGITGIYRITEVIFSQDSSGSRVYPTLEAYTKPNYEFDPYGD